MASHNESIIEAEKGKNLSPHSLHIRLRVVEVVVLVSILLNMALWFYAGNISAKADNNAPYAASR